MSVVRVQTKAGEFVLENRGDFVTVCASCGRPVTSDDAQEIRRLRSNNKDMGDALRNFLLADGLGDAKAKEMAARHLQDVLARVDESRGL